MTAGLIGVALLAAVLAPAAAVADGLTVAVGKALFDRDWVAAPASTRATDGLGPLHNARSCAACHPRGGRAPDAAGRGLVVRFPVAGAYGAQLQTAGIHGQAAEGEVIQRHAEEVRILDDGAAIALRRPRFTIAAPAFGPLPRRLSPRLAPSLRGVGLLDRVPRAALEAIADPGDRNGDGIRGRLGAGRFGLRAEQSGLEEQVAEALLRDLGLASPRRPFPAGDCTPAQAACREALHGDRDGTPGVEVTEPVLAAIGAFLGALRPASAQAAAPNPRGGLLFRAIGCAACHVPELPLGPGEERIAPFSDLLLHDLGPALADQGAAADEQSARLWRTAPLWNLGRDLAAGAPLLHDGRARDALEAVLWHGGEAAAAQARFRALAADERADLLAFLAQL